MKNQKLDKILNTIAKAYNCPVEWVKEAYIGGLESITDIVDYCNAKKEILESKKQEVKNEK